MGEGAGISMKNTVLILILFIVSGQVYSQGNWFQAGSDTLTAVQQLHADSICAERGHSLSDYGSSTLAYCPPYTVDYPDYTITIYPACNTTSIFCKRCRRTISLHDKVDTVITWRRKP